MNAVGFRLAGVHFVLRSHDPAGWEWTLPPAYDRFRSNEVPREANAEYEICDPERPIEPAMTLREILWEGETWRMGRTPDGQIGLDLQCATDGSWVPVARVELDFSRGSIRPLHGRHARPSRFALNHPYDQTLVLNRLLHFRAGVVHACGIVEDGGGYIFAGRSGAGKTTLARLWRRHGALLLNDDRVILRERDGRVFLASTPWHGEEAEVNDAMVPLRAIVHLRHASENDLRRLEVPEALTALLATTVAPFYSPEGLRRLVDLWADVAEAIPSYALSFTPDARAVQFCRRAFSEMGA